MEDLRVLLLDGLLIASMKRWPAAGDFRANAAQHGRSERWQPTDAEMQLAIEAAEVTGCVFAGVDLMYDEFDQALVVEVNAVPGWRAIQETCQVNVPESLFCWLESTAPGSSVAG